MIDQLPIPETVDMDEPGGDYESEGEGDFEHSQSIDDLLSKRRKLNEDERVQRCRERNRVHARNTRERKRAQMDLLQQKIQELSDEKKALENYEPEESVASILMSLSGSPKSRDKASAMGSSAQTASSSGDDSSKRFAADAIERIKSEISATLSDDEELEMNSDLLLKDKSACSGADLEMIRRERNRMHAKKTRLRKKKMLSEMESIIHGLERDIRELRQKHSLGPDEYTSGMDFRRRPAGSSLTISGAIGGSKFTGFRHVHRSDGGAALKGLPPLAESTHHSSMTGNSAGSVTSFESMAFMLQPALLKATTSTIKESELGLNTNPPFPMLYSQAFSSSSSASSSSKQSSTHGDSATTTPALSTSDSSCSSNSSGSSGSGSGRSGGTDYNQYVPSGALHISPSTSTGSLEGEGEGSVTAGITHHMGSMQGAMDRLGRNKRSSSELSSGATSRAASMDEMDGGSAAAGRDEQRYPGILYLAATAAAEGHQ